MVNFQLPSVVVDVQLQCTSLRGVALLLYRRELCCHSWLCRRRVVSGNDNSH